MRIAFVTSSRSDWALIRKVVEMAKKEITVAVIVTGSHLSKSYGKTINDVGLADERVDILMMANNPVSTATSMGLGLVKFAELFAKRKYDYVFLAGDRFEILSAGIAARCLNMPIIHYCGGETTGTQDQTWRDMLTIMATIHLTQHESYSARIRQMRPDATVYTVGSTLVDNLNSITYEPEETIKNRFTVARYLLFTYHADTNLSKQANINYVYTAIEAIQKYWNYNVIFTYSNQDACGNEINRIIAETCRKQPEYRYVKTAGTELYANLVKYADGVIGNSSSGIYEAPYFGTMTINIGDRQRGRMRGESVIDCRCSVDEIGNAIAKLRKCEPEKPFGEHAVEKIMEVIRKL